MVKLITDDYYTLTYTFNDNSYFILYGSRRMAFDSYQKAVDFQALFLEIVDLKTVQ